MKKPASTLFLPSLTEDMHARGWDKLDVIIVTGDTYIDSSFSGAAAIGRHLEAHGWKVGIIPQPDMQSSSDIKRLGEPRLFWGVTAGCVDSMVSNYTALKKPRRDDDFTPGGSNNRRPDRASIQYVNLIRKNFKNTVPIVLGGLEASLRRVAHYDYWDDAIRRPILFDAKADYLLYGMAEKAVAELASAFDSKTWVPGIRGLCRIAQEPVKGYIELPSYEDCADKPTYTGMFRLFYDNQDPLTAKGLQQKVGDRWLIHNPPQPVMSEKEIDDAYGYPYLREVHPAERKKGIVKALDTIRFSLTTHRGCYGECNFCAIAVHQGRTVVSRSGASICAEARTFVNDSRFTGTITDAGGPTANMYKMECEKKCTAGACSNKRCLFPSVCPSMPLDHEGLASLYRDILAIPGVKRLFIGSGIRYDLVMADKKGGIGYIRQLAALHTSGMLRVAPEHSVDKILKLMGKPTFALLPPFREQFERASREAGKKQKLSYYFIAAYPGCTEQEMELLAKKVIAEMGIAPEQIQIFTPLPSTWAAVMYWTETDPFTGGKLFVEKTGLGKNRQKDLLLN